MYLLFVISFQYVDKVPRCVFYALYGVALGAVCRQRGSEYGKAEQATPKKHISQDFHFFHRVMLVDISLAPTLLTVPPVFHPMLPAGPGARSLSLPPEPQLSIGLRGSSFSFSDTQNPGPLRSIRHGLC